MPVSCILSFDWFTRLPVPFSLARVIILDSGFSTRLKIALISNSFMEDVITKFQVVIVNLGVLKLWHRRLDDVETFVI